MGRAGAAFDGAHLSLSRSTLVLGFAHFCCMLTIRSVRSVSSLLRCLSSPPLPLPLFRAVLFCFAHSLGIYLIRSSSSSSRDAATRSRSGRDVQGVAWGVLLLYRHQQQLLSLLLLLLLLCASFALAEQSREGGRVVRGELLPRAAKCKGNGDHQKATTQTCLASDCPLSSPFPCFFPMRLPIKIAH